MGPRDARPADGGRRSGGRPVEPRPRQPAAPARGSADLGVPAPYHPRESEIDDEVRSDLDRWARDGDVRFVGEDAPRRFPATRREALAGLRRFVEHRLATFGAYEDAMLAGDTTMSHSLLSSSLNLGLLDPAECVERAEARWRSGDVPLNSAEGFVRQIAGWREFVWHVYWYFGTRYRESNALRHHEPLPAWFTELSSDATDANCLSHVLDQVRTTGWTHHIPRLMVLGSLSLQRGWDPRAVTDWFHRSFVDGYDWVMVPNVVGMSQYADGGRMTTKPYTSGGAYIDRMSDFCGPCRYKPSVRVGEDACPFTMRLLEPPAPPPRPVRAQRADDPGGARPGQAHRPRRAAGAGAPPRGLRSWGTGTSCAAPVAARKGKDGHMERPHGGTPLG